MNAEYIDKEDAVGVIADWAEDTRVRVDSDHGQIYQRCIRLIRDLPSADVVSRENYKSMERTVDKLNKALAERKHGKWNGIPQLKTAKCPLCGKETDILIYNDGVLEGCRYCGVRPPIQTNGDRIRMMSDEKLAEIISSLGNCDTCYLYLNRGCNINTSCKDAVLEWLRKEADDGKS